MSTTADLDQAARDLDAAERTVCALQLHGVEVSSLHRLLVLSRSFMDELRTRRSGRATYPTGGRK